MEVLAPGSKKPKAQSVDVREFQPILDAGAALDQWNTAALAVVGNAYSCFQAIAAPVLAANKLAVFYRVQIETVPLPVSRLIFRSGAAAGNILAEFDLEQLACEQVMVGYFSEPVVIDPTTTFAAQVLCRIATGVLARVQLGALIFEPAGSLIA
jgi:CRISPR/Cas system endoribonuclease Cas6 (RAMP superfamily)